MADYGWQTTEDGGQKDRMADDGGQRTEGPDDGRRGTRGRRAEGRWTREGQGKRDDGRPLRYDDGRCKTQGRN